MAIRDIIIGTAGSLLPAHLIDALELALLREIEGAGAALAAAVVQGVTARLDSYKRGHESGPETTARHAEEDKQFKTWEERRAELAAGEK